MIPGRTKPHGENAERRGRRMTGREYWKSRLHRYGETIGRVTKMLTHRKERRESKRLAREAETHDECYVELGRVHLCTRASVDGSCDYCETVDGRSIEAVAEYASTCDSCGELCMNELLRDRLDGSDLGDCPACRKVDNLDDELEDA